MDGDRQALVALLEMLSLQQYITAVVVPAAKRSKARSDVDADSETTRVFVDATGKPTRVASIAELEAHPHVWRNAIKKSHHRDVLKGYLSARAKKREQQKAKKKKKGGDGAAADDGEPSLPGADDVDAAERRFQTFQTVKNVLKDLRELQIKKAKLDQRQAAILRGGSAANVATRLAQQRDRLRDPAPPAGVDDAKARLSPEEELDAVRAEIQALVDKIDSAKDRLEVAQELLGFTAPAAKQGKPGLGSSGKSRNGAARPASAPAGKPRPAAPTAAARPQQFSDDVPTGSSAAAPTAHGEKMAEDPSDGGQKTVETPAGHGQDTQRDPRRANRPQVRIDVDRAFQDVEFVQADSASDTTPTATRRMSSSTGRGAPSVPSSVGFGWFRRLPRTKSEVQSANRVNAELYRRQLRRDMADAVERRLDGDVAAALHKATPESEREKQYGKRDPPVAPAAAAAANPSKRNLGTAKFTPARPKTASKAAAATSTASAPQAAAPAAAATPRTSPALAAALKARDTRAMHAAMTVSGTRASTLSLGLDLPLDHGAQMKCGAILGGRPRRGVPSSTAAATGAPGGSASATRLHL